MYTISHALAFLGGFVPALFWLIFWNAEDRKHPEPKRLLVLSFAVGVLTVPIALAAQRASAEALFGGTSIVTAFNSSPFLGALSLFLFAAIEEICKWVAAFAAALWSRETDEPIDYIIYMIAAALGFAAYESALFIFTPIDDGRLVAGLVMGNLRAIGAMLLHVVASSVIGLGFAFGFYRRRRERVKYTIAAFLVAIILHTLFNIVIIKGASGSGIGSAAAFMSVWAAIVVLLLMFERAKKIHPTAN